MDLSGPAKVEDDLLEQAIRPLDSGRCQLDLAVPDVHCATCISSIEGNLKKLDMVEGARVNLSTKRVRITFDPKKGRPSRMLEAIARSGHKALLLENVDADKDDQLAELLRSLAVAGFAAGNIMLFSISIWSGADAVTREMFHWISALIAIPAIGYAGQPFFRSALASLRQKRLNMDVPITLAVILSLIMSVVETARGAEQAYFDASVTLLFFLLIGRTLDHMMRERARGAVKNLARLAPRNVLRLMEDGQTESVAISSLVPGMKIMVTAGQRLPVDALVVEGKSDVDVSLVTGEAVPEAGVPGVHLLAGSLVLSGSLTLEVEAAADKSFLARMIELMEAAEHSRAGYQRMADRAAAIYAPLVHLVAFAAFVGWGLFGGDWHQAILIGIAVLIITCPCALGLAVPMVHIVCAGRLFEAGIIMKDGAALERLAEVDTVVFDKTGTLTAGHPALVGRPQGEPHAIAMAARIARHSQHPYSRAIVAATGTADMFEGSVEEVVGKGLLARNAAGEWKLGRPDWCAPQADIPPAEGSELWLSLNGEKQARFTLSDTVRPEAQATLDRLKQIGCRILLLSGDQQAPVMDLAEKLGISEARWGMAPAEKVAAIRALQEQGHHVLMVGDGINDAPALRTADTSMAPASAADVGRNAADFILTRDNMEGVAATLVLARRAARTVKQNFGLAILYNMVAVPLAVAGFVTPLLAALAMSSSSILVTLNSLKLRFGNRELRRLRFPTSTDRSSSPVPKSPAASGTAEPAR